MTVCAHIDCLQPVYSRGVCRLHYRRAIAAGRRAASHGRGSGASHLSMTQDERSLARLEDLEWLLSNGEWPMRAARRAGFPTVRAARESAVVYGFRAAVHMLDEAVDRAAA